MGTSQDRAAHNTNFYQRGDKIPGLKVEGQNVLMVREAIKWAGQYVIENGPVFLEMFTYRYHGHSMSDPGITYRTKDEIADVRANRDPLEIVRKQLIDLNWATADELKAYEKEARKKLEDEVAQIRNDPWPVEADLYKNVGVTDGHFMRGVEYNASIHPPRI